MRENFRLNIPKMPFTIGPQPKPVNPNGLPSVLDFSCSFDNRLGTITQQQSEALSRALSQAYELGAMLGTPLNDDPVGLPYVTDFLNFTLDALNGKQGRALEVGAGVGFVTRCLTELGWEAIGLEPGSGYEAEQRRHGGHILREAFPSRNVRPPFDLIISYAVLEHLNDPVAMLISMREFLAPGGAIVVAVPDCTQELLAGDTSILIHEHLSYFTAETLRHAFELAGLRAVVQVSNYGRSLYAVGTIPSSPFQPIAPSDSASISTYCERAQKQNFYVSQVIADWSRRGSLGIFSPARGLGLLDPSWPVRFFDDDRNLEGKYYPPFRNPIESRSALVDSPVDRLVIMSRTFGSRIRESLSVFGLASEIFTLEELTSP